MNDVIRIFTLIHLDIIHTFPDYGSEVIDTCQSQSDYRLVTSDWPAKEHKSI